MLSGCEPSTDPLLLKQLASDLRRIPARPQPPTSKVAMGHNCSGKHRDEKYTGKNPARVKGEPTPRGSPHPQSTTPSRDARKGETAAPSLDMTWPAATAPYTLSNPPPQYSEAFIPNQRGDGVPVSEAPRPQTIPDHSIPCGSAYQDEGGSAESGVPALPPGRVAQQPACSGGGSGQGQRGEEGYEACRQVSPGWGDKDLWTSLGPNRAALGGNSNSIE